VAPQILITRAAGRAQLLPLRRLVVGLNLVAVGAGLQRRAAWTAALAGRASTVAAEEAVARPSQLLLVFGPRGRVATRAQISPGTVRVVVARPVVATARTAVLPSRGPVVVVARVPQARDLRGLAGTVERVAAAVVGVALARTA